MLKINPELLHSTYRGIHPINGQEIEKKLSEFTQEELIAIYNADKMNIYLFDFSSDFNSVAETPKQKQAENVNTTAPNTRATGSTTTTAKATVSEG